MTRLNAILSSASLALALGLSAPAALAANDGGTQQPAANAAASAQSNNFQKDQLQKFVAVQGDINSIRKEYIPKIEKADNKKEAGTYQMKAQKEMVQAIQDKGLSVKTYNQIGHAYQSNPSVRKRVNEIASNN